jgi:raffinose/stachyose/melibiose transport system permease protein
LRQSALPATAEPPGEAFSLGAAFRIVRKSSRGPGAAFRRLIWPLARPVLATLSIYDGLNVWNNFILPLVLTQSSNVAVLPLGLTKFQGQYAIDVPAVMAAVLLSVLPLVALFVAMRKQVMRSLGAIVLR